MKIGLFWDAAIGINSYYVKEGVAHAFSNNQPYMYHSSLSTTCFNASHNLPFLWGDGCFINLSEWTDKELPDLDLDLIFFSNERMGITDEQKHLYSIDKIRKKYKNAKITGHIKEVYVKEGRENNRLEFLKSCDGISVECFSREKLIKQYLEMEKLIGKEFNLISQPINIDYIYNNFYSNEKEKCIFAYTPNPVHRRGNTYEFCKYLAKKYNLPVEYKSTDGNKNSLSQSQFVKSWCNKIFHFNLDPTFIHPGQQCLLVANVGCINLGGNNESHSILYPGLDGLNLEHLEEKFVELLKDDQKITQTVSYAWDVLNKNYGFSTIKKQIETIYNLI